MERREVEEGVAEVIGTGEETATPDMEVTTKATGPGVLVCLTNFTFFELRVRLC